MIVRETGYLIPLDHFFSPKTGKAHNNVNNKNYIVSENTQIQNVTF